MQDRYQVLAQKERDSVELTRRTFDVPSLEGQKAEWSMNIEANRVGDSRKNPDTKLLGYVTKYPQLEEPVVTNLYGRWPEGLTDADLIAAAKAGPGRVPALSNKTPAFVVDDEGIEGGKYAEFDDEAHVRFGQDKKGQLRIQGIHASVGVRGREMIEWMRREYGRKIVADDVASSAIGFWNRMQDDGLVRSWSEKIFTGQLVPVESGQTELMLERSEKARASIDSARKAPAP